MRAECGFISSPNAGQSSSMIQAMTAYGDFAPCNFALMDGGESSAIIAPVHILDIIEFYIQESLGNSVPDNAVP